MFNASTLKLEKIKYFDKFKKSVNEKIKKLGKKVCHYQISETESTKKTQRYPT